MFENPNFLKKKYDLHNAPETEAAAKRAQILTGEKVPKDPADRIQNYLDRFKEIIERKEPAKRERGIEALKKILHDKFIIKEDEIPESYFENQKRLAREQGHGDVEITDEARAQLIEVIITDQKSSLDNWIDYLSSKDATYPDWLKYYSFRSIISLGEYDKEKKQFTKRSTGTTKPFPDINREALAYVLDAIEKKQAGIKTIPPINLETDEAEYEKFQKLLQGENFGKLYAFAIDQVTPASKEKLADTRGKWVKYDRNSDHMPLVESLQGHGTGWCTAGESTAQAQLKNGDFYVYYSYDEKGKPNIPRVAIRMQEGNIAEVRGIAPEQNMDPNIGDVVKAKLAEFPDGQLYEKKSSDMKLLTEIEKKVKQQKPLTKDDLIFLYEINNTIEGFGYQRDPRIAEVIKSRDIKEDISLITGYSKNQISLTEEEWRKSPKTIKYHYGNLYLHGLQSAQGLKLPETMNGYLYLGGLQSAQGLKLPETMNGGLGLSGLQSAQGLKLPETMNGNLHLEGIQSAQGLKLPETMNGYLGLSGLQSAKGLKLPETINGYLDLSGLQSAQGLKLPEMMNGGLGLSGLQSAKGLQLPASISGSLYLDGLESAEKEELRKKYPQYKNKIN